MERVLSNKGQVTLFMEAQSIMELSEEEIMNLDPDLKKDHQKTIQSRLKQLRNK